MGKACDHCRAVPPSVLGNLLPCAAPRPPFPGARRPLGLDGWRFAFVSLAAVSAAAGVANLLLTEEPLRQQQHAAPKAGWTPPCQGSPAAAPGAAAAPASPWCEAAAGGGDGERQPLRWGAPREGGSPRQRAAAASKEWAAAEPSGEPGWQAASGRQQHVGACDGPGLPLREQARRICAEVLCVLRVPTFVLIVVQASRGPRGAHVGTDAST